MRLITRLAFAHTLGTFTVFQTNPGITIFRNGTFSRRLHRLLVLVRIIITAKTRNGKRRKYNLKIFVHTVLLENDTENLFIA